MLWQDENGTITLASDDLSLKVTTDRKLWVKHKADKQYSQVGLVPYGMSREQKEAYLLQLRQKARQKKEEKAESQSVERPVESNGEENKTEKKVEEEKEVNEDGRYIESDG